MKYKTKYNKILQLEIYEYLRIRTLHSTPYTCDCCLKITFYTGMYFFFFLAKKKNQYLVENNIFSTAKLNDISEIK